MGRAATGALLAACWYGQSAAIDSSSDLLSIRRMCVEKFAGDEQSAAPAREATMAALFAFKKFKISDNCEKADAVLKGAVAEKTAVRTRAEGEGAGFGSAAGAASANRSTASAAMHAVTGGSSEGLYSSETRFEASITLRITSKDGDVLWAYTQQSPGGKVKGAVTDAVDRAVKQLARELDRPAQVRPEPTVRSEASSLQSR